jgi:hypothetical protein
VAGVALRVAAAPVPALLAPSVVVVLVAPDSAAALYLCTAVWWTGTGLLMTVSGLHRLSGRPALDAVAFGVAAALVAAATAVTWFAGLDPRTHMLVLPAGIAVIVVAATVALPRSWRRPRVAPRRRLVRGFLRSTWLLGLSELLDAATVSSVYLVLAAAGRVGDSGPFYLAMTVSAFLCSFLLYQLKLHQPAASVRLRGAGAAHGRARAVALLRAVEWSGVGVGVALAAALSLPAGRAVLTTSGGVSWFVVLAVLVLAEMVMAMLVMYAVFLVENTNSSVLRLTGSAAVIRFVANLLFAAALVPALGAVGGFTAIMLGLAAKASALRRMLVRRHPELDAPLVGRSRNDE